MMLIAIWLLAWGGAPKIDLEEHNIHQLLAQQEADWNRGDIASFMKGYEKTNRLIFTSGGRLYRGWQSALDRYKRSYPDREAMGTLKFSELEIRVLGKDAAMVLGKWSLTRKADHPHGVFTLVLTKRHGVWQIMHDHTSSSSE